MATRALGLSTMTESQSNKYITHNTALHEIDTWVGGVKSRTNSGPPGSPSEGDAYIVDSATGAWSTFTAGDLAVYYLDSGGTAAWFNISPVEGPSVYVEDEAIYCFWDASASAWKAIGAVSTPEDIADTTYSITTADAHKTLRFTSSSAVTVSVVSGDFALGTMVTIRRAGTGAVTISASGSPTPTINGAVTLASQHDYRTLQYIGANEWDAY